MHTIEPGAKVYFLGIAGTGMAAVSGLIKAHGYEVEGSDQGVYPPTSDLLAELGIKVYSPYDPKNILEAKPQLVVVANALSRGQPELEEVLKQGIKYTSFPALLGEVVLSKKKSLVVSGTHGKTTTVSLLAYLLRSLGEDPGYLIGGVPRDLPLPFAKGAGQLFAIEGDEYDTAFFDKNSKFLHYRPHYVILNNLEYDHADIFPDLAAIEAQFAKLIKLAPGPRHLIANIDDPGIEKHLRDLGLIEQVIGVRTCVGSLGSADYSLTAIESQAGLGQKIKTHSKVFGRLELETRLTGTHNAANITMVLALLGELQAKGLIKPINIKLFKAALAAFEGPKRRLECLYNQGDIQVYEDFAHHPTAVKLVIEGFRAQHPQARIHVAFEPKNATARRNVFTEAFARALSLADQVYLGKCPVDLRIQLDARMDTDILAQKIGTKAKAYAENEELLEDLKGKIRPGDRLIFMSAGSFSGIQHSLISFLDGSTGGGA